MNFNAGMTFNVRTCGEPHTLIHYTVEKVEGGRVWLQYWYKSSRNGNGYKGAVVDEISDIERRVKGQMWYVADIEHNVQYHLPDEVFEI